MAFVSDIFVAPRHRRAAVARRDRRHLPAEAVLPEHAGRVQPAGRSARVRVGPPRRRCGVGRVRARSLRCAGSNGSLSPMMPGVDRRARRAARRWCVSSPTPRSSRTPRSGIATTRSPSPPCWRWASWGCSASPSPSRWAAAAVTSPGCAWRSRSSPGSTSRSPSPWRPASAWAPTRSTSSARPSSSSAGCPTCAPVGRSAAFGLTEPDAGSDAGGTRTRATRRATSGEWVIDGAKAFITNSGTPITSVVTVTALTGPGEISTILVPAGTTGLRGAAGVSQDGLARVRHPRAHVRRVPRARGPPARRARAGGSPSSSRSSTTAASPSPRSPSA